MTPPERSILPPPSPRARLAAATAGSLLAAAALVGAGCGGGDGSNPFDNAATIQNPAGASSAQKLSFAYFQRCVQPVLRTDLLIRIGGTTAVNNCAASGCHDDTNGTGGALRLIGSAADVDLTSAGPAPEAIRATEMYRNFYSAQGETIIGSPAQSRLLNKPLVNGVLHGGGLVFDSIDDPNAKILRYWISRPMPVGQDEFSAAAANLFTPADVVSGACNTE